MMRIGHASSNAVANSNLANPNPSLRPQGSLSRPNLPTPQPILPSQAAQFITQSNAVGVHTAAQASVVANNGHMAPVVAVSSPEGELARQLQSMQLATANEEAEMESYERAYIARLYEATGVMMPPRQKGIPKVRYILEVLYGLHSYANISVHFDPHGALTEWDLKDLIVQWQCEMVQFVMAELPSYVSLSLGAATCCAYLPSNPLTHSHPAATSTTSPSIQI